MQSKPEANLVWFSSTDLLLAAPFALYVLWLTAFPMAGPLLGDKVAMDWFLWPHALGLLVCAHRAAVRYARQLFIGGTLLTAAATFAYALLMDACGAALLAMLGFAAAPMLIQTLLQLKITSRPILLSALCLGVGNFAMLVLTYLALSDFVKLATLSVALLSVLLVPRQPMEFTTGQGAVVCRYLPFIFLFQITSGLMYGLLLPFYYKNSWLSGSEVLIYVVIAIATAKYLGQKREAMPVCSILLATLAFVFFQMPSRTLAGNLGVWSMMAAAGIIDIAVLTYAFSSTEQPRGVACCFATMLAGIASGSQMVLWINDKALGTAALCALIFSAIALFITRYPQQNMLAASLPEQISPPPPSQPVSNSNEESPHDLPVAPRHPFSNQEWRVLQAVAQYQTYREAATALGITESSVKTYMQRMYKKTGTFRRQQLLDKIAATFGELPPA